MATVPTIWPAGQDYLPPLIATAFLVVIPILAVFLSKRMPSSPRELGELPLVKILVIMILFTSLVFTQLAAVILLGVGSSYNAAACSAGIWICLLVYVSQKVLLYLFLMERVFLVHSHRLPGRASRLKNKWWLVSMLLFTLWLGVAIAMIIGRVAFLRSHDGACIIGLRLYATASVLTVDFVVNVFLTLAFVVPIWKSQFQTARALARNSVVAALVALATSIANMLILTLQHGHQQSFVCLGSCVLDVAINASIIYFVTRTGHNEGGDELETSARAHSNTYNNHMHTQSYPRGGGGAVGLESTNGQSQHATSMGKHALPSQRKSVGFPTAALTGITVFSETATVAEDGDTTFVPTGPVWRVDQVHVPPLNYMVEKADPDDKVELHGIAEMRIPLQTHDSDETMTDSGKDVEKEVV